MFARLWAVISTLGLALSGLVMVATPAAADSTLCTGNSFSACINAGYTAHGYENNYGNSYWRAHAGHNCTNYVGYILTQNGDPGPGALMGNAGQWDNTISAHPEWGYTMDSTPAVGSIAQWDGNPGHVAYVESVSANSIIVSEDNYPSGPFSWRTISVGSSNWPTRFLHIADVVESASDGSLLQVENTGSAWSIYNITQATGIPIKGKPGVLWGADGPNVFAADTAGALRQFTTCPNGVGWCTYVVLSAGALGSAGVSVVHTGSAIEVFATTTDGTLLQVENTGSGWQVYNITQAADNVHIKGAPAVLWGSSGPSVFAVDTSGAMRQFVPCSTGWCAHVLTGNNVFAGGVDATMNGANIELFARSTGNHLYQVEYASGSGWSVYDVTNFSGGVQVKGTPGILWTNDGPNVYISDSAGRLRQFTICSSGGWCTYKLTANGALGDGSGVDVVHTGSAIEVFAGSQ